MLLAQPASQRRKNMSYFYDDHKNFCCGESFFEKQQFRFDGNKCFDKKFICCFDGDDNLRDQHFAFDDFRKFDKSKDFGHFDKKEKNCFECEIKCKPFKPYCSQKSVYCLLPFICCCKFPFKSW